MVLIRVVFCVVTDTFEKKYGFYVSTIDTDKFGSIIPVYRVYNFKREHFIANESIL